MALPGLPKGVFTADDAYAVSCLCPAVLDATPFTIEARTTVHDSEASPEPRPVHHGLPNLKDCRATARSYATFCSAIDDGHSVRAIQLAISRMAWSRSNGTE